MAEPTLEEIFGVNATQTATDLIIKKADLEEVGLTPNVSNTAESLVVALVLKMKLKLNATNQEADPDIQVTIGNLQKFTRFRNSQNYDQYTSSIAFETPSDEAILDPDDF